MGTAAKSHISKIETEQAKILRTITNDPWYVRNDEIRKDLGMDFGKTNGPRRNKKVCGKVQTKNFFFFYLLEYFQSILVENFQ